MERLVFWIVLNGFAGMTIEDKIKEILADPHAHGKPLEELVVVRLAVKELARSLDRLLRRRKKKRTGN